MRSRARVFWGNRAYLTVRLPVTLVGSLPPPPVSLPGLNHSALEGSWENENETEFVHIGRLVSSCDPRESERQAWQTPHFVEQLGEDSWQWWEGHRTRRLSESSAGRYTQEREPLSESIIGQHKAHCEWIDALYEFGKHPVLDAFLSASRWSKSFGLHTEGDRLFAVYGVKWFYPWTKRGFSADLARAVRCAKRHGVPCRVHAG